MTLARDEFVFLIILIVNLVIALIYLLVGCLLVVPTQNLLEEEDAQETLHDNRRTYLIRFIVMLLCPVVAPLFFLTGHVFYLLIFGKTANLADVVFSKERVEIHLKADEEMERDIVPLEEALLVNEKKELRAVMMGVMRKDVRESLAAITLALECEDSETSHYAAAVLSDELNKFRINVQRLARQMQEEDEEQTDCEEMLLDYMGSILRQRVFSDYEQRKFVGIMETAAASLYGKDASKVTLERYEEACLRTLELKDFENTGKWCGRMAEQFPNELSTYTCRLKLYFSQQDRDSFFETMNALKKSDVVIDNETLELIRVFG